MDVVVARRPPPQQRARTTLTAAYAVNVVLAYMLMLAVMSYNVGCLVAVVAGLVAGHYFFTSGAASGLAGRAQADPCCPQNVDY